MDEDTEAWSTKRACHAGVADARLEVILAMAAHSDTGREGKHDGMITVMDAAHVTESRGCLPAQAVGWYTFCTL